MMAEGEGFLSRWSRRKLAERRDEPVDDTQAGEPAPETSGAVADEAPGEEAEPERHAAEDIDIDSLTKDSDFTIFMQKGVPAAVKRRALRKLWTTDPVLANLDGLNDYEDMERVYGIGPIGKTSWQIGRGFLTDEELGSEAEEPGEAKVAETDTAPEETPATLPDDSAEATDGGATGEDEEDTPRST